MDELRTPARSLHVCLLGEPGTGQSSFLRAYRGHAVEQVRKQESFVTVAEVDGEPFRCRFTDIGGQMMFDPLRKPIIATAHVVLLCVSLANPNVEATENKWAAMVREVNKGAPVIVVGLQCDARSLSLSDEGEEGMALADRINAVGYLECSAVTGYRVSEVVDKALVTGKEHFLTGQQMRRSFVSQSRAKDQHLRDLGTRQDNHDCVCADAQAEEHHSIGLLGRTDPPDAFDCADEAITLDDDVAAVADDQIRQSLSVLGMTPQGGRHAYLKSTLTGLGLTSLDGLRAFGHLQYVNCSKNQLRSLEPLCALPYLLELNASENLLRRTQSFSGQRQLLSCDLSYNYLSTIGDWSNHRFLRKLCLRGNFIQSISTGLSSCKFLQELDLAENNLMALQNLESCQELITLRLEHNQLSSAAGLEQLRNLQALDLSSNLLVNLQELHAHNHPRLRALAVASNYLSHIQHIEALVPFRALQDLWLVPNPVCALPQFRAQILRRLRQLGNLDAAPISGEEKVKADIVYGDDLAEREETWRAVLPREPFEDRRLVTEQTLMDEEIQLFGQLGGPMNLDSDERLDSIQVGPGSDAEG